MKEKTLGEVYLVTCLVTGKQYVGITTQGYGASLEKARALFFKEEG